MMAGEEQKETYVAGASVRVNCRGRVIHGFTGSIIETNEEAGLCQIMVSRVDWDAFKPRKGTRKPSLAAVVGLWYLPCGQIRVLPGQKKPLHGSEAVQGSEPVETSAKGLGSAVQALVWSMKDLTTACRELVVRLEKTVEIAEKVLEGGQNG